MVKLQCLKLQNYSDFFCSLYAKNKNLDFPKGSFNTGEKSLQGKSKFPVEIWNFRGDFDVYV